jgi:hypothetical protein
MRDQALASIRIVEGLKKSEPLLNGGTKVKSKAAGEDMFGVE